VTTRRDHEGPEAGQPAAGQPAAEAGAREAGAGAREAEAGAREAGAGAWEAEAGAPGAAPGGPVAELARGLRDTAGELASTAHEVARLRAVVDALLEVLAAREVLTPGHLRWFERQREHAPTGGPPVRLRPPIDKHRVAGPDIDCQRYLPLCQARCCSFAVALTAADVESGALRWELERPYLLRHDADGYCAHLDRATGGCAIYDQRPAACREFDCREDRRVWDDFAAAAPAPMPPGLLPPPGGWRP
jgi:hypothetical protein